MITAAEPRWLDGVSQGSQARSPADSQLDASRARCARVLF